MKMISKCQFGGTPAVGQCCNASLWHDPVNTEEHWKITNKQVTWPASPRSKAQVHVYLPVCGAPGWVLLQHSIMLRLFFTIECGIVRFLCTMRVFEVRASSSSP